MTVLDSSAVLALLQDEPGAEEVSAVLGSARLGTVNLAEVVGKLVDAGVPAEPPLRRLGRSGLVLEPLLAADAELAGTLRSVPGGRSLSLGDRCCLALAIRSGSGEVLTTDRMWATLDLPVRVRLIR